MGGGGACVHATNLPFHTFYQRRRRGFLRLIQQRIALRRRLGINRNSYFYSRQLSGHLSLRSPQTHAFLRVCLRLNAAGDEHELSVTSGFDWHPPAVSTAVVLRVALCGQDCLGSGEGGGERAFRRGASTFYPDTYQRRAKKKEKNVAVECVCGAGVRECVCGGVREGCELEEVSVH